MDRCLQLARHFLGPVERNTKPGEGVNRDCGDSKKCNTCLWQAANNISVSERHIAIGYSPSASSRHAP